MDKNKFPLEKKKNKYTGSRVYSVMNINFDGAPKYWWIGLFLIPVCTFVKFSRGLCYLHGLSGVDNLAVFARFRERLGVSWD